MKKRIIVIAIVLLAVLGLGVVAVQAGFFRAEAKQEAQVQQKLFQADSQAKPTVLNLDELPEGTLEPLTRESFDRLVQLAMLIYEEYEEICWQHPRYSAFGRSDLFRGDLQIVKPDHNLSAAIREGGVIAPEDYRKYEKQIWTILQPLLIQSVPPENYTDDEQILGRTPVYSGIPHREGWIVPDLSESGYSSAEEMVLQACYGGERLEQKHFQAMPCESFVLSIFNGFPSVIYWTGQINIEGGMVGETVFPTKEMRELEQQISTRWKAAGK